MERIRCGEDLMRVVRSKFCQLLETIALVRMQEQSTMASADSVS